MTALRRRCELRWDSAQQGGDVMLSHRESFLFLFFVNKDDIFGLMLTF